MAAIAGTIFFVFVCRASSRGRVSSQQPAAEKSRARASVLNAKPAWVAFAFAGLWAGQRRGVVYMGLVKSMHPSHLTP